MEMSKIAVAFKKKSRVEVKQWNNFKKNQRVI